MLVPSPVFIGLSDSSVNGTSLTATLPSGIVAGDTLLLIVNTLSSTISGDPSGWVKRFEQARGTSLTSRIALYTRVATGSDTSAVITMGTSGGHVAEIQLWRNVLWVGSVPYNTSATLNGSPSTG